MKEINVDPEYTRRWRDNVPPPADKPDKWNKNFDFTYKLSIKELNLAAIFDLVGFVYWESNLEQYVFHITQLWVDKNLYHIERVPPSLIESLELAVRAQFQIQCIRWSKSDERTVLQ